MLRDNERKEVFVQIRRMKEKDRPQVIALYCAVFSESPWREEWSNDQATQQLDQAHVHWWVAHEEGHIIGFIAGALAEAFVLAEQFRFSAPCEPAMRMIYLAELGTCPTRRGEGIARALTNHLISFATEQCATTFTVRTRPGTGNHPWYERCPDLTHWQRYDDGRILYGCSGLPQL